MAIRATRVILIEKVHLKILIELADEVTQMKKIIFKVVQSCLSTCIKIPSKEKSLEKILTYLHRNIAFTEACKKNLPIRQFTL